jgi:hypothetical protein
LCMKHQDNEVLRHDINESLQVCNTG